MSETRTEYGIRVQGKVIEAGTRADAEEALANLRRLIPRERLALMERTVEITTVIVEDWREGIERQSIAIGNCVRER